MHSPHIGIHQLPAQGPTKGNECLPSVSLLDMGPYFADLVETGLLPCTEKSDHNCKDMTDMIYLHIAETCAVLGESWDHRSPRTTDETGCQAVVQSC